MDKSVMKENLIIGLDKLSLELDVVSKKMQMISTAIAYLDSDEYIKNNTDIERIIIETLN